jgi:hypothetical protein
MYQQEDLLPSNRNYSLFIGCFTLIFTFGIIIYLISSNNSVEETKPSIVFQPEQTRPRADLTIYNQDSDFDLIPNFIEDEAILNTFLPEITYCEQSNPYCSENPLNSEFFISIIIDSSTSMDIPATERVSKIDLVRNELNLFLNQAIAAPFIKTHIVGLGNKGTKSFIADNESCVTNFTFKNFNQLLRSSETNPLVLQNLTANGKSPIGYTLEQVEANFPNPQGNNLVIIITDGNDDCGNDLNKTFREVLSRGKVKKINLISIFSPQDENQRLREATESNGGQFTTSTSIFQTIDLWKNDFILSNWCKYQNQSKINRCLDINYSKAFNILDSRISSTTPQNEENKIREIKSSIDLLLQNYRNNKNQELTKEFEEFYKSFGKN